MSTKQQTYYELKDLHELNRFGASGHKTYFANHQLGKVAKEEEEKKKLTKVIYKENKNGNADATKLEAAISELARLVFGSFHTPKVHLVKDSRGKVSGIAIEHISKIIFESEKSQKKQGNVIFHKYDKDTEEYKPKEIDINNEYKSNLADEIPFYFLSQMPRKFFQKLLEKHNDSESDIKIDMESLANLFAGSYGLEEDDLHKGNISFYIVEENEKKVYKFRKIDHDLMFINKIMSFSDGRLPNIGYTDRTFNVTKRDVENFPDVSGPHYWPTKKRYAVNPQDAKVYRGDSQRNAFASLKDDADLQRYKWKHFLKQILLTDEMIRASLEQHLDRSNPDDNIKYSLLLNAAVARFDEMRALLLSIAEFRAYLNGENGIQDIKDIRNDLISYANNISSPVMVAELDEVINTLANGSEMIEADDTPLHVAIKLDQFRFEESRKAEGFYRNINVANAVGKKPLDLVMDKIKEKVNNEELSKEEIIDLKSQYKIALYLIKYKAKPNAAQKVTLKQVVDKVKSNSLVINPFHHCATETVIRELKRQVVHVRDDTSLSLRQSKLEAKRLIKFAVQAIKENGINQGDFQKLRQSVKKDHEFKFIQQLRSKLWFVRYFRGLFGHTKTYDSIMKMIDKNIPTMGMGMGWANSQSFFANTITRVQDPVLPNGMTRALVVA